MERKAKTNVFLKPKFMGPFATSRCFKAGRMSSRPSERKFQRHLPDTRSARASHRPKTAKDIAANAAELRVVENIEKFRPEFQIRFFCDQRALVEREVPVVYAGTVEETTVGIAENARVFGGEGGCIEPLSSFPDVKEMDRLAIVVGNICSPTAAQGSIVTLTEAHRETGSEASDTRDRPTREQLALDAVC